MTLYNKLFTEEIKTAVFPTAISVDEILSYALMSTINPTLDVEFIEKNELENYKDKQDCILVNIGAGEFDSHQAFFDVNDAGQKLTGFSKLWKELGEDILGTKELADVFDETVVTDIDNVMMERSKPEYEFDLMNILLYFMPEWNENPEGDELITAFNKATLVAKISLERIINHFVQIDKANDIICSTFDEESKSCNGVLSFDRFIPGIAKMVDLCNLDSEYKVYFVVHPEFPGSEKFVYEACLVDGYTKQVVVPKDTEIPTTKNELVELLKTNCK